MLELALKKLSKKVVRPVKWENEYQPKQITTGHLKQFWDNVDVQRLQRISDIKANKI